MRDWNEYKETFNLSEDIFQLARSGEVNKLREFIDSNPELDINQKNHKGYSPLMISAYNSNYAASELLLEAGADPNSADFSGNTVLMGAAFKGDADLVTLLIGLGSNKELKNQEGLTAKDWASAFGRTNIVPILSMKETQHSKLQNMVNAVKIIWGFLKPTSRKEATV